MAWIDGSTGTATAIATAYALDWAIGDPPRPTHPVVLIGRVIAFLERQLYGAAERRARLLGAGAVLVALVVGGTAGTSLLALDLAGRVSPWLRWTLQVWWLQTALAARGLYGTAYGVERPVAAGDLPSARRQLRALVGRDPEGLPASEIRRAVIESVAENTSDAVLAPLFWAAVGGAPLALAYKAVNTLDSMIGYPDARYHLFGRAAARLDDAANWLPARLGGLLTVAAAALCGLRASAAWRVWRQDARHHASPNAGIGEAVYAGALGLRLGGQSRYDGELRDRGVLNAAGRAPQERDVGRALRLLAVASTLGATAAAARWLL